MSDSLQLVKQLREITGAGMLDCKNYLLRANNNLDDAIKLFRSESGKKAEKKGSRIAAEGIVNFYENSESMLIIEINSETDFVSRNEQFQKFVRDCSKIALTSDGNLDNLLEAQLIQIS